MHLDRHRSTSCHRALPSHTPRASIASDVVRVDARHWGVARRHPNTSAPLVDAIDPKLLEDCVPGGMLNGECRGKEEGLHYDSKFKNRPGNGSWKSRTIEGLPWNIISVLSSCGRRLLPICIDVQYIASILEFRHRFTRTSTCTPDSRAMERAIRCRLDISRISLGVNLLNLDQFARRKKLCNYFKYMAFNLLGKSGTPSGRSTMCW